MTKAELEARVAELEAELASRPEIAELSTGGCVRVEAARPQKVAGQAYALGDLVATIEIVQPGLTTNFVVDAIRGGQFRCVEPQPGELVEESHGAEEPVDESGVNDGDQDQAPQGDDDQSGE